MASNARIKLSSFLEKVNVFLKCELRRVMQKFMDKFKSSFLTTIPIPEEIG